MFQDCLPDFQTTSEPCLNSLKYKSKDLNGSPYIHRPNTASIRCSQLLKHNQHHNSKDAHQKSDSEKTSGSESGIFCSADDIETLNNENGTDRLDDCSPTTKVELLNSNHNTSANIDNLSIYLKRTEKKQERSEAIKIMTDESQAFQIQNQNRRKLQTALTDYRYVPDMSAKQTETNGLMKDDFAQGLEKCTYLKRSTNPNLNPNSQKKAVRQKRVITCSKQNRRLYEYRDIDRKFLKRSRLKASSFLSSNMKNRQQNVCVERTLQNKQTTLKQAESVQNFPGKDLGHVVMGAREKIIKEKYKDNETCCSHIVLNKDTSLLKYLNLSRESKEYQHPHLNDEEKNMKDGKNMDNDDTCIKVPLRELSNSYPLNCSSVDHERMKDLSESCQSFSMNQQYVADSQGMITNEIRKHLKDEHEEKQMILYRHYFHLLEKLNISKKEAELAADLQMIEKLCMGGTNHCGNISRSCSDHQKRSHDRASPKPIHEKIESKDSEINSIKSLFDSNYPKLTGFLPPKPISNRTSDTGSQLSCSNFPLQSNNTKQSYSHDNAYHKPFCYHQDFSCCKCLYQESSEKEPSVNGLCTKLYTKPTSKKCQKQCSDHSCRCEETLLPLMSHLQVQTTKKEPKYIKHKTTKNSSRNIANSNNKVTSVLLQNSSEKDDSLELHKKCQHNKENSHSKCRDSNPNPNPNLTEHKSKPDLFSVRNPNDFMAAKEAADILKNEKIKFEYSSEQYFILEDPSEKETACLRKRDSLSKYAGRDLKYPHCAINKDILNKVEHKNISKDIDSYETINNEPNYELISNLRLNTSVRSSNSEILQKNQNLFKKIFRKTKNTSTLHTSSV